MLKIFCGSNTADSRTYFIAEMNKLEKAGIACMVLSLTDLENMDAAFAQHASLFNEQTAFFAENILSKKPQRDLLKKYSNSPDILIHVWEETVEDRNLKKYFPKAQFSVHTFPATIWKLLDGLYPGNMKSSVKALESLYQTSEPIMLLYMIQQRIKELILIAHSLPGKVKRAPWQEKTLLMQASKWQHTRLKGFYKKLYDIEYGTKTGTQPYSIQEALDILFCFYLQ